MLTSTCNLNTNTFGMGRNLVIVYWNNNKFLLRIATTINSNEHRQIAHFRKYLPL